MSVFYRIAYWVGLTPWERMVALPIAEQIATLLDREERGRRTPYGSALDVGCGSGIWSVRLATRGWQVTGVDIVAKAVRAARRRIQDAGVGARIVHGDVTALRATGVGSGFEFVLDLGAIHGLDEVQRRAAGREISGVTAAGTTMLMLAWTPGHRGPLPSGMSREDVRAAFSKWTITDEEAADVSGAPGFVRKAEPRFYRLRRE